MKTEEKIDHFFRQAIKYLGEGAEKTQIQTIIVALMFQIERMYEKENGLS